MRFRGVNSQWSLPLTVDRFCLDHWNVDVKNALHLFLDPAHIPILVSDDMVWHPVCRLYLFSDVARVPLAPAKSCESNSCPF